MALTHSSEMRVPPQKYFSSTKSAAIQGKACGVDSWPPTILGSGPARPHSPARLGEGGGAGGARFYSV